MLSEPQATSADLLFDLAGIRVRVSAWFWLAAGLLGWNVCQSFTLGDQRLLLPHSTAVNWFWIVYVPLGLNPISLKLFTNYALELAPSIAEHPRYVSIVGAALAAPFVLSPLVGLAVDRFGFRHVFVTGAAAILAGAVIAAGLPEPRHQTR